MYRILSYSHLIVIKCTFCSHEQKHSSFDSWNRVLSLNLLKGIILYQTRQPNKICHVGVCLCTDWPFFQEMTAAGQPSNEDFSIRTWFFSRRQRLRMPHRNSINIQWWHPYCQNDEQQIGFRRRGTTFLIACYPDGNVNVCAYLPACVKSEYIMFFLHLKLRTSNNTSNCGNIIPLIKDVTYSQHKIRWYRKRHNACIYEGH
jgi:hypothetical protein